ncbi:MAG: flp pilus-assembly TadE/G-like family protein [Aeromicrobium sp.]|uniref:Rv3654c family TadE-like protein n=1 Tax=Aeromicrobium sp. TaxID=1871063 RepID=UPI0039E3162A
MTSRRRPSDGAVSVLAVAVALVLVMATVALIEVGAAVRGKHAAAAAADLAALAASRAVEAGEDGCAAAREVARRNGAEVVTCRLDAAVATVTAEVRAPRWWSWGWRSRQSARAAPSSYVDPGS